MTQRLQDLLPCFQGVIPSLMATCGADGEPNVTYISQVHYLDERHVALSCQFFNKTRRNVAENPYAAVIVHDPLSFETWRLRLRFLRAETAGPLFESMSLRIDVIASHTGMAGVFRLISADVYELLALEPVEGFLLPADPLLDAAPPLPTPAGPLTELRSLQVVSERIARARDLDELMNGALAALDELFGFSHSMVLLLDERGERLYTLASRGLGPGGIGAEVRLGEGLLGTVAERRRMLRISGLGAELHYGRAIRERAQECGQGGEPRPEIPLPGLCDAQAALCLPLLAGERLVGVLAFESRDPLCFDDWDEAFLQIVGHQIATAIARMQLAEEEPAGGVRPRAPRSAPDSGRTTRRLVYYRNDDCIFVDGEYLIRNVPAKILWKVLDRFRREGQSEFTNRELRLDPTLGLPPIKDNLESRLILLRKRLAEKCPDLRLVAVRRGRFALELDCGLELVEKDSA